MTILRLAAVAIVLAALTAAPARAEPIRIGYIPILPMTQLFVMQGEGWLGEAGIEVETVRFQSGPAIVQATASGDMDVMFFGIGPAMVSRARGQDVKVVAANVIKQVAAIGRGPFAALAEEHGVEAAFAEFVAAEGRPVKLATLPKGSVPDTTLRYWLQKQIAVDPATYEIVGMGANQVQQSLLAGAVDAASILEPILTIVERREPSARILARGGDMLPNQPGAVMAVRERLIAAQPDTVATLVTLHKRATDLMLADPDTAARHVHAAISNGLLPRDIITAAIKSPSNTFVSDPATIIDSTRVMHDFQAEIGTLKRAVPLDELFDRSFYAQAVGE